MSEHELHDTQPHSIEQTQPQSVRPTKENTQPRLQRVGWPRWFLAVLFILLIFAGALAGYGSGIGQRRAAQATLVAAQLQEQLELGIQKMNAGQYDLARQHFDFIVQHAPNFPGVMEAYTELLLRMQLSPTPTNTPTLQMTPTVDLRSAETIYENVRSALKARDWNAALDNLDSLRKNYPAYKTAEVDSLYYLALRMRGVSKIVLGPGQVCQDINLEGGIYDLTRAERFGTLDAVAQNLRTYARLYLIGASYWDQDWEKAQSFFAQVMAGYPSMMDASCMTATERWRYATIKRAEKFLASGDYCAAEEQFNLAFSVTSQKNEPHYPTATQVAIECDGGNGGNGPTATLVPTPTETPTPTP
ncbi:MAG: hypothetical protein N2049_04805 [Anaerolineales bacterium]|nr:hypothetical protein [Anaerolineales bacterium]MCX7608522.1 hypothetical protein [Anaerolineales bacterium]MDW8227562.1 hypothetical protein [Anaerolineales bacterium]